MHDAYGIATMEKILHNCPSLLLSSSDLRSPALRHQVKYRTQANYRHQYLFVVAHNVLGMLTSMFLLF